MTQTASAILERVLLHPVVLGGIALGVAVGIVVGLVILSSSVAKRLHRGVTEELSARLGPMPDDDKHALSVLVEGAAADVRELRDEMRQFRENHDQLALRVRKLGGRVRRLEGRADNTDKVLRVQTRQADAAPAYGDDEIDDLEDVGA